jgi:integrase
LAKQCAVKGAGLQRAQLPPGNWFAPPGNSRGGSGGNKAVGALGLLSELHEPFETMALLCVCLGLRISEALAIRWSDLDWLGSTLSIKRGIVEQHVDDCKTEGSAKALVLPEGLLARLKAWKQASQFRDAEDWVFASPYSIGRHAYSYGGTRDELPRAAKGFWDWTCEHSRLPALCRIRHSRHTYRSWLDARGAAISVQQKMMRHASIKSTMDIYGGCCNG